MLGSNCIVLHGHLPWVHHPLEKDFLEEDWYFEAVIEVYLPLLFLLDDLEERQIPSRLACGLTPPLLEMMRSPSLRAKTARFLEARKELADREVTRVRANPQLHRAARHYSGRHQQLLQLWERLDGDLVEGFRRHRETGRIEILASAATHPILPFLVTDEMKRAQIRIGVELYRELFGAAPAGFWLPECAFAPGLDELLVAEGIRYVILEEHALLGADPIPPTGVHRPVRLPSGLVAFGRDQESGRQVWAAEVGYPGDPDYRELYKDLGFDGDYDAIRPYLHDDGVRRNLGIKYHRVTGRDLPLHEKKLWDPSVAKGRTRVHADHYLEQRGQQSEGIKTHLGSAPTILSPYDMELFGHWWYEGPWFLEALFERAHGPHRPPVRLATPSQTLRDKGPFPEATPLSSTWGEDGFFKVWLGDDNAWVLPHQQELELRMLEAARTENPTPEQERILDQMLRELILLQASDWAFILHHKTAEYYAKKRLRDHVHRFLVLEDALLHGTPLDPEENKRLHAEDNLFPGLNFRVLTGSAATREGSRLGSGENLDDPDSRG